MNDLKDLCVWIAVQLGDNPVLFISLAVIVMMALYL